MKILILSLVLLSMQTFAEKRKVDFRGFIKIKTLNIGESKKFNNFEIKGVWDDTKGNYGKGVCIDSGLSEKETRKADMLYCEFEDQNEQKFWKRLGRKGSEQKAGVGYTVLVGGTNNYIDYLGKECVYAINYTKDAFILNESCDY